MKIEAAKAIATISRFLFKLKLIDFKTCDLIIDKITAMSLEYELNRYKTDGGKDDKTD